MTLNELYTLEGFQGLKRLAAAAGTDAQYLRQCATGWRNKRPSPELAEKLIAAEPRLTWEGIFKPRRQGQPAARSGVAE